MEQIFSENSPRTLLAAIPRGMGILWRLAPSGQVPNAHHERGAHTIVESAAPRERPSGRDAFFDPFDRPRIREIEVLQHFGGTPLAGLWATS
jgi:hypothetical protein